MAPPDPHRAAVMATLTSRLEEARERLAANRAAYDAAKARLAGPGAVASRDAAWARLRQLAADAPAGGDEALFTLGRIAELVALMDADTAVVEEYERLREHVRKLEQAAAGAEG